MHIALYRGHQYAAGRLAVHRFQRFDKRDKVRHGLLHHARALHHLRQKQFAFAEQITHHVHAAHERAFNYFDGV